jgi:hypothetical protein
MFKFSALTMNAADLQRRVEQFKRDSETPVQGAEPDFKQRLKEATQRRLSGAHQASRIEANVSASNESFASKVARAVKTRTASRAQTVKQHAEQAERERSRYPGYGIKRRQRTKGE